VDIAIRQPSPGAPSTQSSGSATASRKTSLNMVRPVISRSGRMSMPGACMSSRKYVMPWCFRSGSVRARQMAQSRIDACRATWSGVMAIGTALTSRECGVWQN